MGPHPNVGVTDDQLYNLSASVIEHPDTTWFTPAKWLFHCFSEHVDFHGRKTKNGPEWSFALTCRHFWQKAIGSGFITGLQSLTNSQRHIYISQFMMNIKLQIWSSLGVGIAQWLERQTRDWKVAGSNPCWSSGRIFFSRVDFLCWLLFRYLFHPHVTAVARKRSQSFCQKRRWQVTAKHAYTLRMWLCMKWHGAWLYGVHRTCTETAAVSCGTSHASAVSTPLRWIFNNNKKEKKKKAL